ncbi:MAG TPA: PQQ-dependent sugar dehydrogenase [Gemmatimonadales bacterium]|nr:PQQ-dependent sugar dehydrogenase [Gemmatimonadales bacterium]
MRQRGWSRLAVAAASVVALGGCLSRDVTEPPGSGRAITLFVRADVSASGVAIVAVEVTAPDITTPLVFNIPIANGIASGTITVPTGSSRTITMRAFDAGGVETHRGAVTVSIQPGSNPTIALVLVPLAGDVPIDVTLGSFVVTVTPAADTLPIGGTAMLTATIVDANGDPVIEPVTWATLDPDIATVASTGDRTAQVTAVEPGETSVVAAFGGSGGSAAIVVSAAPAAQLVASGLNAPLYLTQPLGDTTRLFVVEQPGRIRVIRNGTLLPTPFLDISSLISFSSERGLLSMAFHPNYANNGHFFVFYTDPAGNLQVARYTVSADPEVANPGSALPIISVSHPGFSNHNGGLVKFGPDGFLYIGTGDGGGGGDPNGNGQDSTVLLGKILRIDVNAGSPYVVPASNPFVGLPPARPEIWAYGLRNPWRFSFDRVTHDLYIGDVGENAREEVDIQPPGSAGGENYGWNIMEGTICYPPPTTGCSQTGLVLPVLDYPTHVGGTCSITGGYVYRGARLPILTGHYFYGDYCSGWVRSFRYVNGTVQEQHEYTPEFGILGNITSFGEDTRGELYIVTQGGSVYRIVPALP